MGNIEHTTSESGWIEERGVRVWGRRMRALEVDDLKRAEVPLKTNLHIIRHLETISPKVRMRMCGARLIEEDGEERSIDDAFLDAELATAGSKFNAAIDDPETVVQVMRASATARVGAGDTVSWIEHPKTKQWRARLAFSVDEAEKQLLGIASGQTLGSLSVVPLTPRLAPRVRRELRGSGEERDRIEVNVVHGISPPLTDEMVFELVRLSLDAPVEIYTAYTGIVAPHFPRRREQTDEEFLYNQSWWDKHVFVK